MNKSRKRFGGLFSAALLLVTQLQPARAGNQTVALGENWNLEGTWQLTVGYFNLPQNGQCTVKIPTGSVGGVNRPVIISKKGSGYNVNVNVPAEISVSGNQAVFIEELQYGKLEWVGTISQKVDPASKKQFTTISGTETCKGGQATLPFTFVREDIAQNCPRFETMLTEAKELQKIADTLEKDDKAYHTAAIDIILRGYRSPYAVYMLDIPSGEIPEFFRDEEQILAVRSQLIEHIRTKARNRKKFADTGINGNFLPDAPVYSKENIELFCTLDSSKFTKEFWDSLWMAGYIDYDLYKETETKIIIVSYKDYFENLAEVATSVLIPVEKPLLFIAGYASKAFKGFSLTKLGIKSIQALKARELPKAAIEEIGLFSKAEAAANSMAALSRATLPAGEEFATIIHIGTLAKKLNIVSAETANAEIVRTLGGKPPFLEGTNVTRYKVGEKGLNIVRFWGGDSEELGYYLTFESEVIDARSDAIALKDALALPPKNTMEHVSVIKVKPGAEIEVGTVGGNFGFDGGGIQVRLMKDKEQFSTILKRLQ